MFAKALELSAAIFARLRVPINEFPFRLIPLADARVSKEDKDTIRRCFHESPQCCLDGAFTLPLRHRNRRLGDVVPLIGKLAKQSPCTNMGLEGLLSQIKASVPTSQRRRPTAERLAFAGYLTQLLQRHKSHGHEDCRRPVSREELLETNVPIAAAAKRRRTDTGAPAAVRWHLRYANERHAESLATLATLPTPAQAAQRRKAFVKEWARLPDAGKAEFPARWTNVEQQEFLEGPEASPELYRLYRF